MKKRDELGDPSSCLNKAADDELIFVLLGRDVAAPAAIRAWCGERVRRAKNDWSDAQIAEALAFANQVEGASLSALDQSVAQQQLGAAVREAAYLSDSDPQAAASRSELRFLVKVLARIVEGKPIRQAFGAPGDWGYGTPIGKALAALHGVKTP